MTEFTIGTLLWAACLGHLLGDFILQNDVQARNKSSHTGWCLLHVLLYTPAVVACLSLFDSRWLDWHWVAAISVPHFLIDRLRLARRWMWLVGQEDFATGICAPWSVIMVDQVFHAVCLFVTVVIFAH